MRQEVDKIFTQSGTDRVDKIVMKHLDTFHVNGCGSKIPGT